MDGESRLLGLFRVVCAGEAISSHNSRRKRAYKCFKKGAAS